MTDEQEQPTDEPEEKQGPGINLASTAKAAAIGGAAGAAAGAALQAGREAMRDRSDGGGDDEEEQTAEE